ncbi:MAG TPA: serine/threonine-protein kinase [Verrucomicrobiae bacterium]|nr:serine/threonine-protein kinase [Verrucomicrobiae bacterium]
MKAGSAWLWSGLLAAATFLPWLPRLSPYSDQMGLLDRWSFDWLYALLPGSRCDEVMVITMDQKSFLELGQDPDQIFDRKLHATLLGKLTQDGVQAVAMDVFFGHVSNSSADAALAGALRTNGRVALIVDRTPLQRSGILGSEVFFPVDLFRTNAAALGTANPQRDSDGVVRRHFLEGEGLASLPWATARLAGAARLADYARHQPRWFRYYGPPAASLPHVSYVEALRVPAGTFTGKYVFVGGAPWIKKPGEQSDMFRTPYSWWDTTEASGVELAALQFLNLLRGEALSRLSALAEFLWLLCTGLLMMGVLVLGHGRSRVLLLFLVAMGSSAAAFALLVRGQIWFSWLVPVLVQLPLCQLARFTLRTRRAFDFETGPAGASVQPIYEPPLPPPPTPARSAPSLASSGLAAAELPLVADHTLLRRVGSGAYGEVWVARNAVGILHAVKVIHRRVFESSDPFEREFRGITRFMPISRSHPGFVHVLQVGPEEVSDYFYYVMELADDVGQGTELNVETYQPKNLSNFLKRRKRLTTSECLRLGLQMTDAMSRLHQAQLVHRDIKPSNIIFVRGLPKLADIGLVTRIAVDPREVSFLGTRGYIPPEGPGSPQADIYSLGKVLYEVYTGLDREQFPSLPTSLLEAPGVGFAALNQAVLRACEFDPRQRYQTAAEFHRELLGLQDQIVPDEVPSPN